MRSTAIFVAALALAVGRAAAQDASTTDTAAGADSTDIPECYTTCVQAAATASDDCNGIDDTQCWCSDDSFWSAVQDCIASNCPDDEQGDASSFQDQYCSSGSNSTASATDSASSAIASITSSIVASASSAAVSASSSIRSSVSQSARSSASASATHSGNAAVAVKMPSVPLMALGATALAFVVGPLLLFA